MSGPHRQFHPSELRVSGETDPTVAESANTLSMARELEALAASDGIRPTDGFEDRVMAAIAAEPVPRVVVRPGSAVRGGWLGAFVLAFRDAWGVAGTGGRPYAVRAQALAFVLVVVLAAGSLAAAGAVTVGGLLERHEGPPPSILPGPTIAPTSTETAQPTETAEPSESAEPTDSAEPSDTAEPTGTDDHGDGGGGGITSPAGTPKPTATDDRGGGGRGGDGGGGGGGDGGGGGGSGRTPESTRTPRPTETPEPSDDHGGSSGGSGDGGSGG